MKNPQIWSNVIFSTNAPGFSISSIVFLTWLITSLMHQTWHRSHKGTSCGLEVPPVIRWPRKSMEKVSVRIFMYVDASPVWHSEKRTLNYTIITLTSYEAPFSKELGGELKDSPTEVFFSCPHVWQTSIRKCTKGFATRASRKGAWKGGEVDTWPRWKLRRSGIWVNMPSWRSLTARLPKWTANAGLISSF